jgi:hypothetical protein
MQIGKLSVRKRSILPLAAGLLTAQAIATLFVWQSNTHLHHSSQAIQASGWLAIPAGPAAASLTTFEAAFRGGLFFTLSIGAGLALATWATLYLWRWVFDGRRALLMLPAGLWLLLVAATAWQGALYPALMVTCVPLATAAAALQKSSSGVSGRYAPGWVVTLGTLVLLTGLWATQLNAQMFSNIRDHLLLSNPVGAKVNDFYYRNTLYAAEAFKSMDQKTLVTWRWVSAVQPPAARRLAGVLSEHDALETPGYAQSDMTVAHLSPTRLSFAFRSGKSLEIETQAFYADPRQWLQTLSSLEDRYGTFRQLTLAGLLLGFPILLFAGVQGALLRLYSRFLSNSRATWAAAATCLLIGLLLLIPVAAGRTEAFETRALGAVLAGDDRHQRVAALRRIEQERIDITRFAQHRELLNSPWVAERYWLARALAFNRNADSMADLLTLLHDPHPNVVCQAFYALGRRGDTSAIAPIKERLLRTDHWYVQWYGYQAMRGLGWRQTRFKSTS